MAEVKLSQQGPRSRRLLAAESELIASLYASVATADFFMDFMARLCELLDLRSGTLGISNRVTQEIKGGWPYRIEPEYLGIYIAGNLASGDRLLEHVLEAPPGRFYCTNLHLDNVDDYQRNSELYRRWAIPQGIHDVAMALLQREGEWVSFVAMQRSVEQGGFSEGECQLLNRLLPHLRRALQMHRYFIDTQGQQQSLGEWLSLIRVPVLLFNEHFEASDRNRAADQFFARNPGVSLVDGRFDLADPTLNSEVGFRVMEAVKTSIGQHSSELGLQVVRPLAGEPFHLVLMPLAGRDGQSVAGAGAVVFIHQAGDGYADDLSALATHYALTPSEQRLCEGLLRGHSLKQMAEASGRRHETLRSQLKDVFAKTATRSQAELVTTLLTHPALLFADFAAPPAN